MVNVLVSLLSCLFFWCTIACAGGVLLVKRDVSELVGQYSPSQSLRSSSGLSNTYLPVRQDAQPQYSNEYGAPPSVSSKLGEQSNQAEPSTVHNLEDLNGFQGTADVDVARYETQNRIRVNSKEVENPNTNRNGIAFENRPAEESNLKSTSDQKTGIYSAVAIHNYLPSDVISGQASPKPIKIIDNSNISPLDTTASDQHFYTSNSSPTSGSQVLKSNNQYEFLGVHSTVQQLPGRVSGVNSISDHNNQVESKSFTNYGPPISQQTSYVPKIQLYQNEPVRMGQAKLVADNAAFINAYNYREPFQNRFGIGSNAQQSNIRNAGKDESANGYGTMSGTVPQALIKNLQFKGILKTTGTPHNYQSRHGDMAVILETDAILPFSNYQRRPEKLSYQLTGFISPSPVPLPSQFIRGQNLNQGALQSSEVFAGLRSGLPNHDFPAPTSSISGDFYQRPINDLGASADVSGLTVADYERQQSAKLRSPSTYQNGFTSPSLQNFQLGVATAQTQNLPASKPEGLDNFTLLSPAGTAEIRASVLRSGAIQGSSVSDDGYNYEGSLNVQNGDGSSGKASLNAAYQRRAGQNYDASGGYVY